ncbi:MAG: DNA primase [Eubacteriales bacterium]|nr:DNA primase [Eubacteriales bacterium]
MFYSDDLVEEVRMKNDIVDVISSYVRLQRKGSSYFGLCPFHNEKSPSFSVSPEKQMYYCFGCGAGGNVFTFLMEYEHYSFPEALKFLAERAGVTLPEKEMDEESKRRQTLKSRILELNKEAAKYFYYQLRRESGAIAMNYLKNRALSDETIHRFGLGYSNKYSDDLYRYLKGKGVSDELLVQSGLMNVDEKRGMYDKFWNRVIFPIMDVNGRVIGFGGRVMGDGKPKYLNSPETAVFDKSRSLYGLNFARTARKKNLLVCEGYMDVISMHQAGFTNAVASLGTALTTQHAALLGRYTDEVILTYDSDEAGVRAALRAIPLLREAGVAAKVLSMQPYKDPDEFIKALGAEEFQKRIDSAQNSFLFETDILQRSYDMNDPQSKTAFYEKVAEKLTGFEQELERENYLEAVASRYQVSRDSLRKMVNRMALRGIGTGSLRTASTKPARPEKESGIIKSQKLMLTWLIEYPGLYAQAKEYLVPEDFTGEPYYTVAGLLFAQYEAGEKSPARIINHFEEPEEQSKVAALFHASLAFPGEAEREKAFKETLQRIAGHGLEESRKRLEPTDMAGLQRLLARQKKLREISGQKFQFDDDGNSHRREYS